MRLGLAVWKLVSVSLASTKRLLSWRSISVRSLRPLRRGTPGRMPKMGWAVGSTPRRLAIGSGEGVAVEDLRVAEDVHQESVGAVGAVELHPWPVGAGSRAAMGGMDLGEAALPFGVGADGGVAGGVEVAVAGLIVSAKDDAGLAAGGLLVQEAAGGGEVLGAGVEVAAEERGRPWVLMLVIHNNCGWFLYSF